MEAHELRPPRGAKRSRKRVGRGNASGHGTYSTRGLKGQQSRAGSHVRPGFEGGQTPLIRRLPRRRGFHNPFRVAYVPVNLRDLARLPEGSDVTPESLRDARVVHSLRQPIKILGVGEVSAALTVRAHRVSSTARAKIEGAGGTVEELTPPARLHEKRKRGRKTHPETAGPKAEEETTASVTPEDEEQDDSGSESDEAG